jgi:hypothetical protein
MELGIPGMDQDSKRFIFAEESIRERNGSKVIPMTNDSTNCEFDSAMNQLLLLDSFSSSGAAVIAASVSLDACFDFSH